jgi:hypothetical protein
MEQRLAAVTYLLYLNRLLMDMAVDYQGNSKRQSLFAYTARVYANSHQESVFRELSKYTVYVSQTFTFRKFLKIVLCFRHC